VKLISEVTHRKTKIVNKTAHPATGNVAVCIRTSIARVDDLEVRRKMKKLLRMRYALVGSGVLVILLGASYMNARQVANDLVGVQPAYTIPWFQPMRNGQISPRWGFTYWAGGETGGMIAEVHVSLFGRIKYKKGMRVSDSNIHGIEY
jgi:hypothetical protein